MITSVSDNLAIAHLTVSFGFADGRHIAIPVEICKEQVESFSTIGGSFRLFERILIAATDRCRPRPHQFWGKDLPLIPVMLNAERPRTLFLSYLRLGNDLVQKPEFHNTITANCTSTVWRLAKVILPDLPQDYLLLFSGQLPEYIDEPHGLPGDMPMAQRRRAAKVMQKAQTIPDGLDFSALIRANRPLA